MQKKSWVCTIIIQLSLCFALYCAINVGQPQTPIYRVANGRTSNEIYFVSVGGGFRPLKEQTHLLKQIWKVVNAYKVGFVINISELGEDDPLLQNATRYFHPLKAPWYTTRALREEVPDYFVNQIKISNGKVLDIIGLNTKSLQDLSNGSGNVQLDWFTRTLEASSSNWHIVVGFHPLFCNQSSEQTEAKGNLDFLHQILSKHGVDAYLSGRSCLNNVHTGGPYFTLPSQGSYSYPPHKETANMFLLHRATPLEIVTYGVSIKGDIVHESTIKQRGRQVM